MLRITARSIAQEFDRRKIAYRVVDESKSILQYQVGDTWRYLRSSLTEFSSPVGVSIADNKRLTKKILRNLNVNIPSGVTVHSIEDAETLMSNHDDIVVKPVDAAHGNGVTTSISTTTELLRAVNHAREVSPSNGVIAQEMVNGHDIRVLTIGNKFAASCERKPACVYGDGATSIRSLIEIENSNTDARGDDYNKSLNKIDMVAAERYLGGRLDAIPQKGQKVQVIGTANIGSGGLSVNKTADIPRLIVEQSENIARYLGLPVCGVDYIASDIDDPTSYTLIELNACPSFGMHIQPAIGKRQPVDILFVDYLMEQS